MGNRDIEQGPTVSIVRRPNRSTCRTVFFNKEIYFVACTVTLFCLTIYTHTPRHQGRHTIYPDQSTIQNLINNRPLFII